jgi:hypothetical protein
MILHTREFSVQETSIIAGHDRETGKRYFCFEISDIYDVQRCIPKNAENSKFWDAIKSIFWIQ